MANINNNDNSKGWRGCRERTLATHGCYTREVWTLWRVLSVLIRTLEGQNQRNEYILKEAILAWFIRYSRDSSTMTASHPMCIHKAESLSSLDLVAGTFLENYWSSIRMGSLEKLNFLAAKKKKIIRGSKFSQSIELRRCHSFPQRLCP